VRLKFKVTGGAEDECYPLTAGPMWDGIAGFTPVDGRFCLDYCDGDLNGDGAITPQDALTAFHCYLAPVDSCPDCADINGSGEITPQDALCIFQKYLEIPSCLDENSGGR
ncbi:MAG: dockerin type I domain-containing protein, partial [bacterium]